MAPHPRQRGGVDQVEVQNVAVSFVGRDIRVVGIGMAVLAIVRCTFVGGG